MNFSSALGTKIVGKNTEQVLLLFTNDASVQEIAPEPYLRLIFHQKRDLIQVTLE